MTTREERAKELLASGAVLFFGNNNFSVASQENDKIYQVSLSGECSCTDARTGHLCKHVIAARLLYGNMNLFGRARAIIENRPQWASGQRVEIGHTSRGVMSEIQEGAREYLYLQVYKMNRRERYMHVKIGALLPTTGWTFTLTDTEYKVFVRKCKERGLAS